MEGAAQVDGDDGVPFVDRKFVHRGHMLNACVVHQNVHLAKGVGGELHHGFNFRGLAHVGTVVSHLHAQGGDFGLWAGVVTEAVEHDVGPLLGQGFGNAQADSACGAGDEGGFTFEHEFFSEARVWRYGKSSLSPA